MTQDVNTPEALLAVLLALETQVWEALWSGDAEADAALLRPDFLGVYPTGFAGREDHAAQLGNGPSIEAFRLSDARLLTLGPDHAMLCYRAEYRRMGHSRDEAMYVSSLWQREVGCDGPEGQEGQGAQNRQKWRNLFSQDTPVSDTAPP